LEHNTRKQTDEQAGALSRLALAPRRKRRPYDNDRRQRARRRKRRARRRDSVGASRRGPRRLALLRLPAERPARLPHIEARPKAVLNAPLVLLRPGRGRADAHQDRKSTRLNSSHRTISY